MILLLLFITIGQEIHPTRLGSQMFGVKKYLSFFRFFYNDVLFIYLLLILLFILLVSFLRECTFM